MDILNTIKTENNLGLVIFESHALENLTGKSKIIAQREIIVDRIEEVFNQRTELYHMDCGAPLFTGLEHFSISISHSAPYFGFQISKQNSGIDVQKLKMDIDKGRRFFVTEEEEKFINSPLDTNIIWSAKEALYKSVLGDVVDYKRSIRVKGFNERELIGVVNEKEVPCAVYRYQEFVSVALL